MPVKAYFFISSWHKRICSFFFGINGGDVCRQIPVFLSSPSVAQTCTGACYFQLIIEDVIYIFIIIKIIIHRMNAEKPAIAF